MTARDVSALMKVGCYDLNSLLKASKREKGNEE